MEVIISILKRDLDGVLVLVLPDPAKKQSMGLV